jgi:uncharacterized membrane protein
MPALLSVVVILKLGTQLGNQRIGLISALLVALSPFLILFSRMARYYALSTLLAMLSLFLFFRILRRNDQRAWLGYVIVTILLLYTNYVAVSIIICQNLVLLLQARRYRSRLKRWSLSQLAILVAYVPWLTVALHQILFLHQDRSSPELMDMVKRMMLGASYLYYSFSIGETITPWRFFIVLPLLGMFSLVLFIGLRTLLKADRAKALTVTSVLVLPVMVLMAVWSTLYPALSFVHFAARLMFIAPVFYIVLAIGVHRLVMEGPDRAGRRQKVWPRWLVIGGLLLGWGIGLRNYYAQVDFINANYIIPWRQIIADLQDVVDEGELVVVVDEPSFRYYQAGLNVSLVESGTGKTSGETIEEIRTLAPPKIWLVTRERSDVSLALTALNRWVTVYEYRPR